MRAVCLGACRLCREEEPVHPVLVRGEAPAGQADRSSSTQCCTEFRTLGTRLRVCRVPCQPLTHADSLAPQASPRRPCPHSLPSPAACSSGGYALTCVRVNGLLPSRVQTVFPQSEVTDAGTGSETHSPNQLPVVSGTALTNNKYFMRMRPGSTVSENGVLVQST